MLRHEYSFGFHRLAAGAAKADCVPIVVNFEIRARNQKVVRLAALLVDGNFGANQDPLGVIDAAAEAAGCILDQVAPLDSLRRLARQMDNRSNERICVGEYLTLGLDRKQTQGPVVPG